MGKFDGILFCSDIDGTLIDDQCKIPNENREKIAYFIKEGGMFTIATGRIPTSILPFDIHVTAPVVSHNGSALYDMAKGEFIWTLPLDDQALEVVEYVDNQYQFSGIEVYCENDIYFYRYNKTLRHHIEYESFKDVSMYYRHTPRPWTKVIFVQQPEQTKIIRHDLDNSLFAQRYSFIQSSPLFYELLHKESSKGIALTMLGKKMNAKMIVAIGDNENDLSMLEAADISFGVSNAIDKVLNIVKYKTTSNNQGAVADAILKLDAML